MSKNAEVNGNMAIRDRVVPSRNQMAGLRMQTLSDTLSTMQMYISAYNKNMTEDEKFVMMEDMRSCSYIVKNLLDVVENTIYSEVEYEPEEDERSF